MNDNLKDMKTKEFTLEMLEEACKKVGFPEIKPLGNELYQIAEAIIGGERFLQEVDDVIKDGVSHINIDLENIDKFKKQ